jgi:hypothetical protein
MRLLDSGWVCRGFLAADLLTARPKTLRLSEYASLNGDAQRTTNIRHHAWRIEALSKGNGSSLDYD